jgi:hypothetical protein
MTYVEETAVSSTVFINVQDGDVVVKGRDEGNVRVVGQAHTSTKDGNTIVNARSSVVVEVPRSHHVEIGNEGVQDVALKSLSTVRLGEIQGSLAANDLESLTTGAIHGDASVRALRKSLVLGDVHGNLSVKDVATLEISAVHGNTEFKSVGTIRFEEVHGHLRVKGSAVVAGDQVNGHAVLKDVEEVTLSQIEGHLEAKNVQTITVEQVNGHAELKDVRGAVRIENVEGNLEIKGIGTSLAVEEVQGDVVIRGAWHPGGDYTFTAQGEVEINTEGSAHFIIKSEGQLATGEGCEVQEDADGTIHVYVGEREGAATVTFEAEGDVTINVRDEEHNPRWHHRHHRHHREWQGNWEWDWEKHGPDVEQEVQRAMAEVRAEMDRAKHTLRHELDKAMREVDVHARGPVGGVIRNAMRDLMNSLRDKPGGVKVEEPVQETPVNDPTEEVKMILQMIADGKITPEQGEQLLQAMGEK